MYHFLFTPVVFINKAKPREAFGLFKHIGILHVNLLCPQNEKNWVDIGRRGW
jgi:hypothetical protein